MLSLWSYHNADGYVYHSLIAFTTLFSVKLILSLLPYKLVSMATLNSFWEKPDGRHGRKEIEGKLLAQAVVLNNCVVAFGRNFKEEFKIWKKW